MIILMVTNVAQEDVIEYCGTWYKSNHNGLPIMFVNPKHIHDDLDSRYDGFANDCDEGVIDIGGIVNPWMRIFPLQIMVVHVLT
jgi:hypothetical protein